MPRPASSNGSSRRAPASSGSRSPIEGPDGREYIAVLSGVGGWSGAIVVGRSRPARSDRRAGFRRRHGRPQAENHSRRDALCFRPSAFLKASCLRRAWALVGARACLLQPRGNSRDGARRRPEAGHRMSPVTIAFSRRRDRLRRPILTARRRRQRASDQRRQAPVRLVQLFRLPFPWRGRHRTRIHGFQLGAMAAPSTRSMRRSTQGRPNGMPSWAGKIPNGEIWKIAAYVRSLAVIGAPCPSRRLRTPASPAPATLETEPGKRSTRDSRSARSAMTSGRMRI